MKQTTFNKLSPEAQIKIRLIEKKLYDINCEKTLIDMQLKELDKMNWRSFWE